MSVDMTAQVMPEVDSERKSSQVSSLVIPQYSSPWNLIGRITLRQNHDKTFLRKQPPRSAVDS